MMGLELVAHILDLAREAEKRNEMLALMPKRSTKNREIQPESERSGSSEGKSQLTEEIPKKSMPNSADQS